MSAHNQTIEHIVLLNIKPDADTTKVAAMIDQVNGLTSLGLTFYISAGELLRSVSTSPNFSHILHCRFSSMNDLQAYYDHPEHLRVVAEYIQPVIDDAVAVDWISDGITDLLKPGSVIRVTLLKLKEDKDLKVTEVIEGIKCQIKTTEHVSVGENFSHEMSKGYSIGIIAVNSDAEVANLHTSKVKDFIENEVVVDYVVPSV